MHSLRYVICDVFTDRPLAGHALAIFTRATELSPGEMQAIARELNLSETAFVLRPAAGGHARLRIFTPRSEVPFAGHAVLGAAAVLGGPLQAETVRLETARGTVDVQLEREGAKIVFGWMAQAVPALGRFAAQPQLLQALGVDRASLPIELYEYGMRHVVVKLGSRATVAELTPDMVRLAQLEADCFSVFAGEGLDYKTRSFAPAHGVGEEAATESAAAVVAWHLFRHQELAVEATARLEQGAEIARPATLYARVVGPLAPPVSLAVGGAAVIVGRGELLV